MTVMGNYKLRVNKRTFGKKFKVPKIFLKIQKISEKYLNNAKYFTKIQKVTEEFKGQKYYKETQKLSEKYLHITKEYLQNSKVAEKYTKTFAENN